MQPLAKALQEKKSEFKEFEIIARRVLNYIPNVLSGYKEKNGYRIYTSEIAGTTKFIRPINFNIFSLDPNEFDKNLKTLNGTIEKIKTVIQISLPRRKKTSITLFTQFNNPLVQVSIY